MNPAALAVACASAVQADEPLRLVIRGVRTKAPEVHLDHRARKGPLGAVAYTLENPTRVVAYFDPVEVLAYLSTVGDLESSGDA